MTLQKIYYLHIVFMFCMPIGMIQAMEIKDGKQEVFQKILPDTQVHCPNGDLFLNSSDMSLLYEISSVVRDSYDDNKDTVQQTGFYIAWNWQDINELLAFLRKAEKQDQAEVMMHLLDKDAFVVISTAGYLGVHVPFRIVSDSILSQATYASCASYKNEFIKHVKKSGLLYTLPTPLQDKVAPYGVPNEDDGKKKESDQPTADNSSIKFIKLSHDGFDFLVPAYCCPKNSNDYLGNSASLGETTTRYKEIVKCGDYFYVPVEYFENSDSVAKKLMRINFRTGAIECLTKMLSNIALRHDGLHVAYTSEFDTHLTIIDITGKGSQKINLSNLEAILDLKRPFRPIVFNGEGSLCVGRFGIKVNPVDYSALDKTSLQTLMSLWREYESATLSTESIEQKISDLWQAQETQSDSYALSKLFATTAMVQKYCVAAKRSRASALWRVAKGAFYLGVPALGFYSMLSRGGFVKTASFVKWTAGTLGTIWTGVNAAMAISAQRDVNRLNAQIYRYSELD